MKRYFIRFFLFACITAWIAGLPSCANIIPPGGGPRDSLPPRLISALPKDSAVNVNTRNITLTFDEYVTLQSAFENLIASPVLKYAPLVDYKLKNVTIKLKDTLEPNTTYSFDFGEAIRDVNEGNIARGLHYVFSTGKTVDFNSYSGKVILAEKGKTDSTLIVILHKNLSDSAVAKENPRYYTRINGKGEFTFRNLPRGEFAVYVVSSRLSKKYDDSTSLFAFRNSPVNINGNTPNDTLYAYEQVKRKPAATPTASAAKPSPVNKEDKRLKYSLNLDNGQQDLLSGLTLTFNRKLANFDSTKFILYDTSFHQLSGYSFSLDTNKKKVMVSYPWKESVHFRLLIAKDAIADSAGTTLTKADTIRFVTKRESDYGSIRIRFTNLDLSKNPVLQFITGDNIVESVPLTQPEFLRKRYHPGGYELRILYDTNKNGVWDTGKFFGAKRQPEVVYAIPKQIAIRANWDNEVTIPL